MKRPNFDGDVYTVANTADSAEQLVMQCSDEKLVEPALMVLNTTHGRSLMRPWVRVRMAIRHDG